MIKTTLQLLVTTVVSFGVFTSIPLLSSGVNARSESLIPAVQPLPAPLQDGEKTSSEKTPYSLQIGMNMMLRAGVNTAVPEGRSTGIGLASMPDINLGLFIPFTRSGSVGVGFDIGYGSVAFANNPASGALVSKPAPNPNTPPTLVPDTTKYNEEYSYFNIFPHIRAGGFFVGVAFGTPVRSNVRQSLPENRSFNGLISSTVLDTALNTNMEVRIGGIVPIIEDSYSRFTINFMAAYSLNPLLTEENAGLYRFSRPNANLTPGAVSVDNLPKPVSIALGIGWYFKIPVIE